MKSKAIKFINVTLYITKEQFIIWLQISYHTMKMCHLLATFYGPKALMCHDYNISHLSGCCIRRKAKGTWHQR